MPMEEDEYVYNPLDRETYEAIAFNAIGRASEVNNLPVYGLAHSTGNSGWSVGFMQWDFGQPGRGDRADDMLARYQQWAPEQARYSDEEIVSLSARLRTRGQVGNSLTTDEKTDLNGFLRSDEGRNFVGELDRQQIERKWTNVGQPLSQIQWLEDLSRTSPAEAAEIVAMTSKLYNQNEIRGDRLIQYLQENNLTPVQTSEWIGDQGIEGLNAMARQAIVSGRDNVLVGIRLMNSLESGEGQMSRIWREEIHANANAGLTNNFNTNASVQLLDKIMRDPVNGERIRAQLDDDAPIRPIVMTGGATETASVEFSRAGELTVRSPGGVESVLTPNGWTRNEIPELDHPRRIEGQHGPGDPQGNVVPEREDPGRSELEHHQQGRASHPGSVEDFLYPSHPHHSLFTALKERLPQELSDDMVGHVMLQAKIGGIGAVDKLDKVAIVGANVFIQGKMPGDRAKVDVSGIAPSLRESLAQSESFDRLQVQQLLQFREQQQDLNERATPRIAV